MPWAETDSDKIYAVAASGRSGVRRARRSELALLCGKGNADLCNDVDRYERCADKKVFQVGAVVWSSVFLYRILAFLIGWDKGILLVHKKLGAFIFRWSMGYPHPNVFHISYVILLAFLFYLLQQKGKKLFGWIVAALVGNVLIFIYSVSFTGFLLTGIYLMLVLYFELRSQFTKPEKALVQCVLPAGLAFSLLAPLLPEGNRFYEVMNKLMNTRLRLSKYFLTQEKITLFGQQFQLADKDLNMDNSYVFALMTYGAVVFVLLMIAYFFTIRNLIKENRRKELAITLGFLIAGISEPFLFNTSFKKCFLNFCGKLSAKRCKSDPAAEHCMDWNLYAGRPESSEKCSGRETGRKTFAGAEKDRGCSRRKEIFDCCVDLRLCRDRRHCFWADGTDAQRVSCAQVDL